MNRIKKDKNAAKLRSYLINISENGYDEFHFRKRLTDFGSATYDNEESARRIRYSKERGFYLYSGSKSIPKYIDLLDDNNIYSSVSKILLSLNKYHFSVAIQYMKYFFENIYKADPLIIMLNDELSEDFFSYSSVTKMKNSFRLKFKKSANFSNQSFYRKLSIVKKPSESRNHEIVGVGIRENDLLVSEIFGEIEEIDFELINNKIDLSEADWDAMTRFISLISLAFERQI